ncbi:hypothetical protein F2Q70_00025339 [Brassica cretica]|uniref:Alcohol dehydrogenase-like N-terminal domain-containing protein n=1 Tax=Brassica cretica TaxID=69181 RepID=A0A8S9L4X5_BRACR|nr:hypothetical protein F2Q70_00025339 [Brassica cretica]
MEALVCRKLGDPTATEPGSTESPVEVRKNHPIPPLTSDTAVRVKVTATSLNFANYLQILGKYQEKPPLPFIPGSDYSGIVDAIGPSVFKHFQSLYYRSYALSFVIFNQDFRGPTHRRRANQ